MTERSGRERTLAAAIEHDRHVESLYLAAVRGVSQAAVLLDVPGLGARGLEEALLRSAPDAPRLTSVEPELGIVQALPPGLCAALAAVPIGVDRDTGGVVVAVLAVDDVHAAAEISFWLDRPVRALVASAPALAAALASVKAAGDSPTDTAFAPAEQGAIAPRTPTSLAPSTRRGPFAEGPAPQGAGDAVLAERDGDAPPSTRRGP